MQADVAEMEAMVAMILEEARLRNTSAALRMEATDMVQLLQSVFDVFKDQAPDVACAALDPRPLKRIAKKCV